MSFRMSSVNIPGHFTANRTPSSKALRSVEETKDRLGIPSNNANASNDILKNHNTKSGGKFKLGESKQTRTNRQRGCLLSMRRKILTPIGIHIRTNVEMLSQPCQEKRANQSRKKGTKNGLDYLKILR